MRKPAPPSTACRLAVWMPRRATTGPASSPSDCSASPRCATPPPMRAPGAVGPLQPGKGPGASRPPAVMATVREQLAALQITRVAQYPAATLGFDKAEGVSLGSAVDAIRAAAKEIGMPQGLSMEFLGAAGAYEKSLSSQLWLILAAMVCVYIVLGVLYESYIHPVTILSTLPSAGVG